MTEQITFYFDGSLLRRLPGDPPAARRDRSTRSPCPKDGREYSPGASAELGSSGDPGTFGVADLGGRVRVVWHYAAADEERTFILDYRLRGLTVAYDDVADVNLKVWGDEWKVGLGHLTARVLLPPADLTAGEVLVYGHPGHRRRGDHSGRRRAQPHAGSRRHPRRAVGGDPGRLPPPRS